MRKMKPGVILGDRRMGYVSALLIAAGLLLTIYFADAARRASEDLRNDAARNASSAQTDLR
jgi:hypothetical protein